MLTAFEFRQILLHRAYIYTRTRIKIKTKRYCCYVIKPNTIHEANFILSYIKCKDFIHYNMGPTVFCNMACGITFLNAIFDFAIPSIKTLLYYIHVYSQVSAEYTTVVVSITSIIAAQPR